MRLCWRAVLDRTCILPDRWNKGTKKFLTCPTLKHQKDFGAESTGKITKFPCQKQICEDNPWNKTKVLRLKSMKCQILAQTTDGQNRAGWKEGTMHRAGVLLQRGQGEQKQKTPPVQNSWFWNAEDTPSQGIPLCPDQVHSRARYQVAVIY